MKGTNAESPVQLNVNDCERDVRVLAGIGCRDTRRLLVAGSAMDCVLHKVEDLSSPEHK
jgi:hypothetical protein